MIINPYRYAAAGAVGVGGSSRSFSTANDYLKITSPPASLNLGGGDWTMTCWYKATDYSGFPRIFEWHDQTGLDNHTTVYIQDGNVIGFREETNGSQIFAQDTSDAGMTQGVWHHIAVVVTSDSPACYVDNGTARSLGTAIISPGNADGFFVGIRGDLNTGTDLRGNLADLRLFNTAVGSTDRTTIYNFGEAATANLVGQWFLDEDSIEDYSSQGNDLDTDVNTVYSTDGPAD